jgi:UDP:flavonoid glycosyltransferase YjiC (YdhE family)
MIKKADLVVFHGGYATMMEVLSAGKPSLVIPFHTEQEGNGRRLEKLGCGKVLKLSRQEYIPVECRWGYGSYDYLIQDRYDLTPEELSREITELLHDRRYAINAQNIKRRLEAYGGATSAVERIERLAAKQRR